MYVQGCMHGDTRGPLKRNIKPDSPKTDVGREIKSSSTIEISNLKSLPTYMVTTFCRVVISYDVFMNFKKS